MRIYIGKEQDTIVCNFRIEGIEVDGHLTPQFPATSPR